IMISTRVSLQWNDDAPEELTSTMAMTSRNNHFVDLRVYKKNYPYHPQQPEPFIEDVFQWVMCGIEHPIEGTGKIKFVTTIDSSSIAPAIKLGGPVVPGPPDIGDFSDIEGSLDRKEVGEMMSPDTGKLESYVEIWRSLDAENHTPETEVREGANKDDVECKVLEVVEDETYHGKLIQLGNWLQGIVHNKKNNDLHVIRAFKEADGWREMIGYGNTEFFPLDSELKRAEVEWKRIE
ncbi:uncharacterized protein CANTADRAFT_51526, partial [Suhomyces tanzawaensis NRRL Y-17324]